MTYKDSLAYIASLQPRGWRLELDRMTEFLERAGLGDSLGGDGGPRYLHVAGTNGKGTVTAMLQSILASSGHLAGATFSPFVFDPRERVQVGRTMISEEEWTCCVEQLRPISDGMVESPFEGPTEFEFKTAMGFLAWKRAGCSWVALEVGLGGRLDATNVVDPACSAIVSIGLDHVQLLGDTHAKIAAEKAGILKAGRPAVMGELVKEAADVVEQTAQERGCPLWRLGEEVSYGDGWVQTPLGRIDGLQPPDLGPFTSHNLAVAVAMIHAAAVPTTDDALREGAAKTSIPGRNQRIWSRGREWILDGAHNPESAASLARHLSQAGRRLVLLTGMVGGHDPAAVYQSLASIAEQVHLVPIDFHRALSPSELVPIVSRFCPKVTEHATLADGIEAAAASAKPGDQILVAGSFYLVGEVGPKLGL